MLKELPALSALNFFDLSALCRRRKDDFIHLPRYRLPSTFEMKNEEEFASVFSAWSDEGLFFHFEVRSPIQHCQYSDPKRGDAIELWIDTRNLKTSGYLTKFCHHFVVFPLKEEGCYGKEITRFRSDDLHLLCDRKDLQIEVKSFKEKYSREERWGNDQDSVINCFTRDDEFAKKNFLDSRINAQRMSQDFPCESVPLEYLNHILLNKSQLELLSLIKEYGLSEWAGQPCDARKDFLEESYNLFGMEKVLII